MPLTFLQYITPSRLAGAEHFFLSVITRLAAQGHRVIVVTKRDTPLRAEIEKLASPRIELHAWHTHGKIDPRTLAKLCRLIWRERVDIINTHLTTASWQGALAGKICGVPSVAVVHATDRKTWFQHADRLIAVSRGVRDALICQGVDAHKIEVLYHGINLENYVPTSDCAAAKVRLGLPGDARTVGVAASLIARKGHRFLLEALAELEQTLGPIHALLAGEGELEAELRARAAELGLGERVHFLGFRRDIAQVIGAMDVFVLPSLKEGLSIAVMEAMALQKPVVCSRIAGLPEVVREGETGLLVPPGDANALRDALEHLFGDADLRRELGRNARRFLEENFEQSVCLDAMENYFCRVVGRAQASQRAPVAPAFSGATAMRPATPETVTATPETATTDIEFEDLEAVRAPLRVAQLIAPARISGAELCTVALCRGLGERGHRVSLGVKESHALIGVARAQGVEAISLRFAGKLNVRAVGRLARWFGENEVEVVATQLSTASLWGTLAARRVGVPSVATVHALNSRTCYLYADRIIAVSRAVKEHLVAQGAPAEKIRVVYNGIDLSRFEPPSDVGAAKVARGLPADALVVGVVAHLTAKKGHGWFLETVAPLSARFPALRVVLVGEGQGRAALETQARALGLGERVMFAGFCPDVVPHMAAMDVVVLPAIAKEGFGRVLVEAGALEKPVVGSDVGGIGEAIVPGQTGFLVAPGEVAQLSAALEKLLESAPLRREMGRAGRARALSHFSQERMVAETEGVYRELIAARKPVAERELAAAS